MKNGRSRLDDSSEQSTRAQANMTASEEAFAKELIAYWLPFVRTHDPNAFKLERSPLWPQYSASTAPNIIVLQRPAGADANSTIVSGSIVEKQDDAETQRCDFVASIEPEQEN